MSRGTMMDSDSSPNIQTPDFSKMVKAMNQSINSAMENMGDIVEEISKMPGPTIEDEIREIENNLGNVMTDEDLEDIESSLRAIRFLNTKESDVGLSANNYKNDEGRMYLEAINGAEITGVNIDRGLTDAAYQGTIDVAIEDIDIDDTE